MKVGTGSLVCAWSAAATLLLFAASTVSAVDLGYLAPPGAPAKAFPRVKRPVADIVSPTRSSEAKRDANNETQQIADLLGLKSSMTVGDLGAGSGYHAVRLAPLLGPAGSSLGM
jgi:predicted methyltransferase